MSEISTRKGKIKILLANGTGDEASSCESPKVSALTAALLAYNFEPVYLPLSAAAKLGKDDKRAYDAIVVLSGNSAGESQTALVDSEPSGFDGKLTIKLFGETAHAHKIVVTPASSHVTAASDPKPYHRKIDSLVRNAVLGRNDSTVLSPEEHRDWMAREPLGAAKCLEECFRSHYPNETRAHTDLVEAFLMGGNDYRAVEELNALKSRRETVRDTMTSDDELERLLNISAFLGHHEGVLLPTTVRTYIVRSRDDGTPLLFVREVFKSLAEEAEATRREHVLLSRLQGQTVRTIKGIEIQPPESAYICECAEKVYLVVPRPQPATRCLKNKLTTGAGHEARIPLLETLCDAHIAIGLAVDKEPDLSPCVASDFYWSLFSRRTLPKLTAAQKALNEVRVDKIKKGKFKPLDTMPLQTEEFRRMYRWIVDHKLLNIPEWLYWPFLDNIPDHYFVSDEQDNKPVKLVRVDWEKPEKRCYFTGAVMGYAYEKVSPRDEEIKYLLNRGVAQIIASRLLQSDDRTDKSLGCALDTVVRHASIDNARRLEEATEEALKHIKGPRLTVAELYELAGVAIVERALTIIGFKADRIRRMTSAVHEIGGLEALAGLRAHAQNLISREEGELGYQQDVLARYVSRLAKTSRTDHERSQWHGFSRALYDSGLVASQTHSPEAPHPSGG